MNIENLKQKINFDRNKIVIALGSLVVILILIFAFKTIFSGKKTNEKTIYDSEFNIRESQTFFIKNKDSDLYALFNSEGKKLTDYSYKNSNVEFYNHAMLVEDVEGKIGIINDAGATIVKFGEYDKITRVSSLYIAEKNDNRYIINSKGKVIKKFDHEITYNYFSVFNEFLIIRDEKKYYVIDFEGDVVYSFDTVEDDTFPSSSYKEGILSIFYNNENYIINIGTNKMLLKISNDEQLCVNSTDEKGKSFVLNSCSNWYTSVDKKRYVVVENNKITYDIDNTDECDSVSYIGKSLRCIKDNKSYFIDTKGKKMYDDVDISLSAYIDNKTFAVNSDNKVDFYNNGKKDYLMKMGNK